MADVLGVGVDLVDIDRIAEMRRKHGERLCGMVFLPAEMEYCRKRGNPDESLAARFAAKEAVMKALGTGWAQGVHFMGIEVTTAEGGQPGVLLHGKTKVKARELGAGKIHLSLSHSKNLAVAHVVVEKNEEISEGSCNNSV